MKNQVTNTFERAIGFDSHPDSFPAALLRGSTPAQALTEKVFNQVPMSQLTSWAKKHSTAQDLFVLEASGNSFQVVRSLALASAGRWSWRVASWANSRKLTPTTTGSAPCALPRPTWPARPRPFGFRTPKPRRDAIVFTLT